MQHRASPRSTFGRRRQALRLVASNGRMLTDREQRPIPTAFGIPEQPMVVTFEGLTEAQQRAALAAFPGGQRFQLAETA